MNKEKLKKLEDKISYLTSALDAAIDDYFKFDNSGETKETILAKIDKYHISKSLKLKLIDKVNSYEENKNNNNNNDTQETP